MAYLKNYIDKIIERGNIGLAESISNTAEDVGNNYLKNFSSLEKQDRCLVL